MIKLIKSGCEPVMRTSVSLPDKSVTCCKIQTIQIIKIKLQKSIIQTKKLEKGDSNTNDESVVKGSKNASNTEDMFPILNSWTQSHSLFLWLPNLSLRRLYKNNKK